MATLLNRRRYMGGGSALPYDAEIECLESTGTQWINTDVVWRKGLNVIIDCVFTNTSTTQVIVGPSASAGYWVGNSTFGRFAATGGRTAFPSNVRSILNVSYLTAQVTLYVNNEYCDSQTYQGNGNFPIALFKPYNSSSYYSSAKIYSAIIKEGDVILFDAIPVRKNGIGYMYDKISGQLFSNQGTGDFILGSDV